MRWNPASLSARPKTTFRKSHQKHVPHSFSLHPTWTPCPQECMDQSPVQIYKHFSVCFVSLRLLVNRDQKSCHFCKLNRPEVKELYSQIPQPETALSYLTEPVIHWATFRTCQQRKKDQNCLQLNSASILPPPPCSCLGRAEVTVRSLSAQWISRSLSHKVIS